MAEIERLRIDRDVHRARPRFLVERDLARRRLKTTAEDGQTAHVIGFEGGVGMAGVDVVRGGGGDGCTGGKYESKSAQSRCA
jgi:hypothetical protein